MLDKKVQESLLDELNEVEQKIDNCLEDIKISSSDVNRDAVELLCELKDKKNKLKDDLETSKSAEVDFWDKLRLAVEAFFREASDKIDNVLVSKKIVDADTLTVTDTLKRCNAEESNFEVIVHIKKLKATAGEVVAEREITVTNTATGKQKVYPAGFDEPSLWHEALKKDVKSGFFNF